MIANLPGALSPQARRSSGVCIFYRSIYCQTCVKSRISVTIPQAQIMSQLLRTAQVVGRPTTASLFRPSHLWYNGAGYEDPAK